MIRSRPRDALDRKVEEAVRRAWERLQAGKPRSIGAKLVERSLQRQVELLDADGPPQ